MDKSKIRFGTKKDYEVYKKILLENIPEAEKLIGKKLKLKESDYKREFIHALSKKGLLLFKEINKEVIGLLSCAFEKKTCYVVNIIIMKKYRRKGYGKQLLNRLKKELKKMQIKDIKLGIRMNNEAIGFFKKTGFKIKTCDYCEMEKII